MPFQPTQSSSQNALVPVSTGLTYKAKSGSLTDAYVAGDKIVVRTVTNASGVNDTQYYNLRSEQVIADADFDETNFDLLGKSTTLSSALKVGNFEFPTLVNVSGIQQPFSLDEWLTANSETLPTDASYAEVEMQLRNGTESDYLLLTRNGTSPTILPQKGQSVRDCVLRNVADITDARFLGVPAVTGSLVVLNVTFWTSNPN